MGKVVAQAMMSLAGYVAKQDNAIGQLFDWLQNREVDVATPAGDFTVHLAPPSERPDGGPEENLRRREEGEFSYFRRQRR